MTHVRGVTELQLLTHYPRGGDERSTNAPNAFNKGKTTMTVRTAFFILAPMALGLLSCSVALFFLPATRRPLR